MSKATERISMSGGEIKKYRIVTEYIEGRLTRAEAAEKLNMTETNVSRLKKKVTHGGPNSLRHGLCGEPSNAKKSAIIKEKILTLYKEKYEPCGFNLSHFHEKLIEVENIADAGRETVRRWLRSENLSSRKVKKGRKHRSRRERRPRVGEMLQLDTSPHDWLGTGEKLHLIVIVDDATTNILYARLFDRDGSLPNLQVLDYVFRKYGLPISIYTDKASWFHYSEQGQKHYTLKALASDDKEIQTQIERALEKLGVEIIAAHSPQAKGRVERQNGVLQDRLISELKLAGIKTKDAANEFIEKVFLPKHNSKFQVPPVDISSAFVPLLNPAVLDETLCLQYESKVQNDNTISKANIYKIQLHATEYRQSWVRAKVIVRIKIDGTVIIRHSETDEVIPSTVIELKKPLEYKHSSRKTEETNFSQAN